MNSAAALKLDEEKLGESAPQAKAEPAAELTSFAADKSKLYPQAKSEDKTDAAPAAKAAEPEAERKEDPYAGHVEQVKVAAPKQQFVSNSRQYQIAPRHQTSLVPALMADLGDNFFTYFLIVVLCALSLVKVYQVQETRMVTAQLNEVRQANEDLQRTWLALTSERQTLSEHGRVRKAAQEQLQMQAPSTEAELVITVQ